MSTFDPMVEAEAELGCEPGELAGTFPPSIHRALAEPTYTWHQHQIPPFDAAEFYDNGPIVTIESNGRSVTVDGRGTRTFLAAGTVASLRTPDDFQTQFPDGVLPDDGDGWDVNGYGWFDLYDGVEHQDRVIYSLNQAVAEAVTFLRSDR